MSEFDRIIGYETIKDELRQICDMIHHPEVYGKLGASMPRGLLLYGDPGLGKTLMARAFIEESGLRAFTVRRDSSDGEFINSIAAAFRAAEEAAPSIVFLDDMDKFANEDEFHRDAEEYVAVQAGIDSVKNSGVFVIATVNCIRSLPDSLVRPGRFDRKIEVLCPTDRDAEKIVEHYLAEKPVADDVNMQDVCKMMSYSSCAELETILNEAAIGAGYARREKIGTADIVKAVLRMQYDCPDDYSRTSGRHLKEIALHEAGHLVACEVLCPGSVGLASVRSTGRDTTGGFIHACEELPVAEHNIIVSLAGKAAVELYCSESCAGGCDDDIYKAYNQIRENPSTNSSHGFGLVEVSNHTICDLSQSFIERNEAVVQAELERYMFRTRDILIKHRTFLEQAAAALEERSTLLHSDIAKLREAYMAQKEAS